MSIFEGIDDVLAEGTFDRQYFEAGKYQVDIERVFVHTKKLGGGKLFIVETQVIRSDNPNIRPGEQRSWVQSMDSFYALPRIKAFIGAFLGYSPKTQIQEINQEVTAEVCNGIVGDESLLAGKRLSLNCTLKKTKAGKDFTHVAWGVAHG